ncbi:protein turtle homolog A-like isoform X2 [Anneissia japonica]|uniref:protein turtle homolog A-like isoform X2 n=1 Tax=Anneissia japonica TaxID=1529436 RepID=UPI001425B5F5|nr:protein turtle homolog A-like isoform X2 [Anneissia japonica]
MFPCLLALMEGARSTTLLLRWICVLLICGVTAQDVSTTTGETVKVVEVSIGESAILPCYQRATGSFLLEWKRRDLQESIFILLTPNAPHIDSRYAGRLDVAEDGVSLQMSDITVEDAGYYQCTVQPLTNWDRSSNFTWISLVIRAPPVFLSTSPDRTVFGIGSRVTFFCITDSPSSTVVTWLKDNQPITMENHFEVTSDSFIIRHLELRDGGLYTCQAENALGTSEHTMLLILQGAPYIIDPPQNITVREHLPAMFKCGWDASPNNVTVNWYYDDGPVQALAKFGLYADILPGDGSLYIGNTDKAFSGWYTCSPSNGIGTPPRAKAFLSVQYLATPLPMPSEVVGALGYPITLNCHADSNPAISNTIWRKDSTMLYPRTEERLKLSKSGSLTIDNVQHSDEGFYSCQPYNALGSAGESGSTYLLVRDAPIFTTRPKAYYQRMPGEEVSIPCTASGSPPPTVRWQKVVGSLPSSRVVTQNDVLKIVQLRKEDHGVYECIISNVVTTLVTSTKLIIEQTSPHAPYNVSVVTSSRTATIYWQPAYDGGLVQSYTVWFRTHNVQDSQWNTLPLLPEDVTSATLYNLRPNTQYEFSVISSNVLGKSMFSEVVIASTKVLSPSPPRSVFINSTPSGLVLHWETPLEYPELVSLYTAEYRINGEMEWAVLIPDISSEAREVTLLGLKSETWYDFRMFAFTPGSFSLPSNIVTGFTGDISAYVITEDGGGLEGSVLAGIISGLVFLIIALVLMIIAIIIVRRRRQKKRALQEILGLPSYVQQVHRSPATPAPSFTLPFKESYSSLKAKFSPVKINPSKTKNHDTPHNGLKQRVLQKSRPKNKLIRKSPRSLLFEVTSEPSVVDHSVPERVLEGADRGEEFQGGNNWNRTMLSSRPDEVLGTSEYALEVSIDDEVIVPPPQFSYGHSRPLQQAIGRNIEQSQSSVRIPTGANNKHGYVFTTSSPLNDITQSSFASENVSTVRLSATRLDYLESSSGRLKDDRTRYIPQKDSYNVRRDENLNIHSGVEDHTMTMREFSMLNAQRKKQYSGNRDFSNQRARSYPNNQSTGLFVLRGDNSTNYIRRERIASPVSSEFYRREQKVPRRRTLSNSSLIRESSIDPPSSQKISADIHHQKIITPSEPVMEHSRQIMCRNDEYKRTAPCLKRRRRTQEIDVPRLSQSDNHYSLDRRKVRSVGDLSRRSARDLNHDRLSYMNSRSTINPRAYGSLNERSYKRESQDFSLPSRYKLSYAERLPVISLPYSQHSVDNNDNLEVSPNYSGVSSSTSGVGSMAPSINNVSPRPSNSAGPLSPYSQGSSGYSSRNTSESVSIRGRNDSVLSNRVYVPNSSSDSTFDEPLRVIDTFSTYEDPFRGFTDISQERRYEVHVGSRQGRINEKPLVHFPNNLVIESPNDSMKEEQWFARLKEEFNEYKRQQEIVQRRKLVSSV